MCQDRPSPNYLYLGNEIEKMINRLLKRAEMKIELFCFHFPENKTAHF